MAHALPTGTVTFLFTDIEGSTRLLQELGASAYADALAEHRRVLREAFLRHDGVEVDTQGDAFFVAFPTAPGAVAVEAPFGGTNTKSLIQLAHARGVILLAARSARLTVFEYSPRSVKSAVAGYGAAEKEQVAKMVRMMIPAAAKLVMSADASDALAVAICHAHTASTAARLKIAR